MSLMSHIKEQVKTSSFYKNMERVECIIYDTTIPNYKLQAYKDILTINSEYKVSHKDFGIAFKIAIIRRNLDDKWENGIYLIDDKLPSIPISTTIDMLKPEDIYRHPYPSVYDKGIASKVIDNILEITNLFPPMYINKNASKEEGEKIKTRQREQWNVLINDYENATEEEALMYLKDRLSRRFGIGLLKHNTIDFIEPKIGVTFTGFVKISKYPFFSVSPIQYSKENKRYIIDSKLQSTCNESTINLAKKIKQLIEENKKTQPEKSSTEEQTSKNEDLIEKLFDKLDDYDELPF